MRSYCSTPLINTPKITNKCKLMLLILVGALVLASIIFLQTSSNHRHPITMLIYNNGSMCRSKTHPANSHHNHWSVRSSASTQTSIVIVIPSRRNNFVARNLVRKTYGFIRNMNKVRILAVVFMLGGADEPHQMQTDIGKLYAEIGEFGDVIMGDFVDTYRNLTRKSIMAYDWLISHCNEADLVVKTDDDVVVDIFKLTDELGKWPRTMFESSNFWCAVHQNEKIFKDKNSRYYVSDEEYAGNVFPAHCAGVGYVTSMMMIRRIIKEIAESFPGPICTHEDAFLTGIVPEKINSANDDPINHIDKNYDWILYVDQHNPKEDAEYLWNTIEQPANETVDFAEFHRRTRSQVFYLLQQNTDFARKYLRLWYLLENSYRSGNVTIKSDI